MLKSNKKLILMLALILIVGVLGGCNKKAPEGFTQEFYDDIVFTTKDVIKTIKNVTIDDMENDTIINSDSYLKFCEKYYDNNSLTVTEQNAFSSLSKIIIYCEINFKYYHKHGEMPSNKDLEEEIDKFSDLIDFEIKSSDIIFK